MLFQDYLTVIRGGGDLATGVAYRLHQAGFPIIVLELAQPLVVRRRVALAAAVLEKQITIENMAGQLVHSMEEAAAVSQTQTIPVLVTAELPPLMPQIVIDARMAKRNIDTHRDQAPFVVALGPGFTAGKDCHAIVETKRGHSLGRVIWEGSAIPNTGTPGRVGGKGAERVLRAPVGGMIQWQVEIGEHVVEGQVIGRVADRPIAAPFAGVVRGLIAEETAVLAGMKVGDVDPRANRQACFTISDKALAVGGGVMEAILTYINQMKSLPH